MKVVPARTPVTAINETHPEINSTTVSDAKSTKSVTTAVNTILDNKSLRRNS